MDSPEAIANKGYETFGEHFMKKGKTEGHSDAISVMKDMNFPAEQIAEVQARLAAMAAKQP